MYMGKGSPTLLLLIVFTCGLNLITAQRSLLNWQRDLQYRLNSYRSQRQLVDDVIRSSINSPRQTINGTTRLIAKDNVKFSDLIIPKGALILDSPVAKPTFRQLVDKTQSYVSSKLKELGQISSQLEAIRRKLSDPSSQFIYKGRPNVPVPQVNSSVIQGTRVFKQFQYARLIETKQADLKQINFTSVTKVITETYMDNPKFGLVDSENRLFFEGRKTLWRSVFQRQLKSGCCDRLKPLHTSRMMRKSADQEILAPVMFQSHDPMGRQPVVIRNLNSASLYNRVLAVGYRPNQPQDNGIVPSPAENFIQIPNIISTQQPNQPEILKTLIIKDIVLIDDAQLSFSGDNKLVIGFNYPSNLQLDLDHSNYLLKFPSSRNGSLFNQRVSGRVVISGEAHFVNGLHADVVNHVPNFERFLAQSVVRVDRPAVIRGSVQFNALPSMLAPTNAPSLPHSVLIIQINGKLDVGLLNGMTLPYDIVPLPPGPNSIRPHETIVVRGPRTFLKRLELSNLVEVSKQVSGLQLPHDVIPLHLNDFMSSVATSNIIFLDGINANHLTVESGHFGDLMMRDVYGDAPSLIMRSAIIRQPDGTDLIRAPLRVMNLKIFGIEPEQGLLNGFRPQDVIELARHQVDSVSGRKTFWAPVEATECFFGDINHLTNWTNHLIRIDRPDTVQTVYTKLAFLAPISTPNLPAPIQIQPPSSVNVSRLDVEFLPNNNPQNYIRNLNFSPELYILHQALARGIANQTGGRYRILDRVELVAGGRVNGIILDDIVTLNKPFRFTDRFTMVGKVEVAGDLSADRINSNYPIDAMDIVQFDKYRVPIVGSRAPIRLNNLVLAANNQANFVHCQLLNGIRFDQFARSIMSLTKPQQVQCPVLFNGPTSLEGMVRTRSSLNGIKDFKSFARDLKSAQYSFENGLQCNTLVIKS